MHTAKLYLLPLPLIAGELGGLPEQAKQTTVSIKHFFVENIRTARRFLKKIDPSINIDSLHFSEINQHSNADLSLMRTWFDNGYDIGVMSEAGCPGIADPGSALVAEAHRIKMPVVPLVGPNSILLALMASGFNGQSFRFIGYLPIESKDRRKAIKNLEQLSAERNETQIFIETPYRNMQLLKDLLQTCTDSTEICVAADLTDPSSESISRYSVAKWKTQAPELNKRPAVFLLMANK